MTQFKRDSGLVGRQRGTVNRRFRGPGDKKGRKRTGRTYVYT